MKTIEEKAIGYVNKTGYRIDGDSSGKHLYDAFLAGAAFAQEWTPVEKELPESGITVLVRDKNGYIGLSCIRHGSWDYKYRNMITHWRLITKK